MTPKIAEDEVGPPPPPLSALQQRCCSEVVDTKIDSKIKLILEKFRIFLSKITVEPYVLCYVLPSAIMGLVTQTLCFEKACSVDLRYDNVTCDHIMRGATEHYYSEERQVQTQASRMTGWSSPMQSAVPGILVLFFGAWSDRTGNRKAFMLLPVLGKLVATVGLFLSAHFYDAIGANETALMDTIPPAITGGKVVMAMAVYSYVADVTTEAERTSRLGIITGVMTLSRPIGIAVSGISIKTIGYFGLISIAAVFYFFGFLYIILRIKNCAGKDVKDKSTKIKQSESDVRSFLIKDLVDTTRVAYRTRSGGKKLQIWLIMCAHMLIVGPVQGEAQMTYWYTRLKFKFSEVDYSLYLTYSVILNFTGLFVTITLFTKRWKMQDSVIGMIAAISRILASGISGIAQSQGMYYVAPALDMFSSAAAITLRSIITKIVDEDEIGKAVSLMGISEALVPVIYGPIYSKVYELSLDSYPGSFYFISAALAVPTVFIFIVLYKLQARASRDEKVSNATSIKEVTRC